MSETRFPPQGAKCVDCGCCQATVYAGNDPLCWACDAGDHKPKSAAPTTAVKNSPARVEIPARVETHTHVAIAPAKPVPPLQKEEKTMPTKFKQGGVPCAIEGCENLAYPPRDFCTTKHYYYVQNPDKAPTGGGTVKTRAPRAAAIRSTPIPSTRATVARSIVSLPPVPVALSCKVAISGEITPAGADAFWSILSMEQKARIIQASLHSILNPKEA
jgi:hypothetical protein